MSASETTERKGKFFKAIVADLKKPKKATPRTLPALQSRQCRPIDRAPSTPKAAHGPTGETVTTGGDAQETPSIIGGLDGTTDVKLAGADRCGDDVRNLTKLLFSRNVTGVLNRSEKLEDIAVIQAIFNANNGPHQPGMEYPATQTPDHKPTASRMEPVLPGLSQPGPVCSAQSDPAQLVHQTTGAPSCAYSPLLVRGKQRNIPSQAKSEGSDEPGGKIATKGTDKRYVGRQRTACAYPMRLPKLSVQQREAGKAGICGREDGVHGSDTVCSRNTNLKRYRCRQMSKLTGSSETASHSTGASVSYPCPRNLTVIQRRGCHTTTRVCSPMPSQRKPLPPIRRRHHSDICTVCPEVHDWKGLARNPRWYPTKTDERCSGETGKDAETESQIEGGACKTETAPTEAVDGEKLQTVSRKEDTEERSDGEVDKDKKDEAEESKWFPESSIAVQVSKDQEAADRDKTHVFPHDSDESRIETNAVCDALRNAHCPCLTGLASFDDTKTSANETAPKSRMPTKVDRDDHRLQARLMMEGMDFECDSKTEIDFHDDTTLLQAVLLRNRALHHGVVSDSGDPESPSEVKVSGGVRVEDARETIRTRKRFEDGNMILNYCTPLLRESSESTGRTKQANHDVDRQASQMLLTPRAEVIMTSRGQQKVVNSSLMAVGRGQSGGKIKSDEEVLRNSPSNEAKNDSSEALLKQEMNRYLHSLRHENAMDKRHHGLSSAQNVPIKVQNLTAVRPITADVSNTSVLASQVTKAVGFIPILTRDEYDSLCKKTTGPPARLPRAPAMPPIVGNPDEMLLIKRFDGEVKGMRLPRRRDGKKKK